MATSKSQSNDTWGMGLLLVFFPETNSSAAASTTAFLDKASSFNSSSSSTPTIKRTNSNNPILTKTQSTISICALLLFLTLLLFTLSTFEPTAPKIPRRFLPEKLPINAPISYNSNFSWFSGGRNATKDIEFPISFALQGMGKLYSRGTRAMSDLVVGHVAEDTTVDEFKLFLRLLHRSALTAKADTVFIFDSSSSALRFESLIREENESFLKLVHLYRELNRTSHNSVSAARFDVSQFVKNVKKEMREPLWGKRLRVNNNLTDSTEEIESESNRLSYGSVLCFEASELDPENSLSGFLDHVPMNLRRWACYPMLLGRVRRNFKHVMLVDVKKLVLLSDPLGRVRNHSPESVYISTKQESSSKHGKRNSDKNQVNSGILMGGTRGIRRFSSAMLTEIVRVAMQHKKKSLVTESGILSQLVGNGHILKNIELVTSNEAIPEASSVNSKGWDGHRIIHRGNSNYDLNSVIMKHICSCEIDYSVYRDCIIS
ncbi:uncharacterized protein [Euphorbia lathyris]|uniref:uncharacterized protein n=1 Tax=Euphorbia lathyris TaxID=212925 RepID=UPI003313CA82